MLATHPPRLLRLGVLCGLLALGGVTCTESPASPGLAHGETAVLRFAPSFSAATAALYAGLGSFGLTVNNVHVHIDHPPAPAFDTVVVVPAGADSLPLALPVVLNGPSEVLTVQVELRDGAQVLFSGTQTVLATAGLTSGPPPTVVIAYVGPGADATQLTIAPRDTAIGITGGVQYRFDARNAQNVPDPGVTVAWSVADGTVGTIASGGAFTPTGKEGRTFVVGATINGLRDSTTITVTAPPTQLTVISGGGQSAAAGAPLALPLVVEARTAAGTPVPGVAVTFTPPASGAVDPATMVTDLTGRAQTVMTLGHSAGTQTFGATAPGLTGASATETATAGAATMLVKVSGDAQTDTANAALPVPFVVRITDTFGNPVGGAMVDWARIAGGGTLSAASSSSDSTGMARVSYTLGATAGTDTITATIHGVPASAALFTATVGARAVSIAIVSGDGQSAAAASALANPLVVRVLDSHGNGVAGVTVGWTVAAGGGAVSPASSTTDSTGAAQATLVLGPAPGLNTVTAQVDPSIRVTFSATGTAPSLTLAPGFMEPGAFGPSARPARSGRPIL